MTEVRIGDMVRFRPSSDQVMVVGRVKGLGDGRVTVEEHYAASVWGESDAEAGTIHTPAIGHVEVVQPKLD